MRVRVTQATSRSSRGREVAGSYKVSGVLRGGGSALAGRVVTLELLVPNATTWTAVGTDRTNKNGKAEFTQALSEGNSYRLTYAGGPRFGPSTSGVVVS